MIIYIEVFETFETILAFLLSEYILLKGPTILADRPPHPRLWLQSVEKYQRSISDNSKRLLKGRSEGWIWVYNLPDDQAKDFSLGEAEVGQASSKHHVAKWPQ